MRLNSKQKLKLIACILLTLQVLFLFPWLGWNLTNGNKAALVIGLWVIGGVRMWQKRDRF